MFNIFKKIQFDKAFKECENDYKTLKKDIQEFCKNNHHYKSSIKKAIDIQKEKQERLSKAIKTLQNQFDDLPKPVTNPRSQGCPRFQSGEELANSVGKINAYYSP